MNRTHRVTLKALRSLIHRSTERPTGGISSWLTRTNSIIELTTTTKSNLDRKFNVWWTFSTLPVEQGHHVAGKAKSVHLQQHLAGEEADKEEIGVLLEVVKPDGLVVVLGGKDAGVEEDEDDNQPKHPLGLADLSSLPTHFTIPPGKRVNITSRCLFRHLSLFEALHSFLPCSLSCVSSWFPSFLCYFSCNSD